MWIGHRYLRHTLGPISLKGFGGCGMLHFFCETPLLQVAVATNPTHYGNPETGCESDEQAVRVQGLSGDFCSPKCNSQGSCPSDVPKGDSATPQCALRTTTGDKYCALICQSDSDCGIWAAWRCLIIEMTGVWLVRKKCIGPDMLVSKTLAVTIQLMNTCSYGSLFNWVIFGNDRWDI